MGKSNSFHLSRGAVIGLSVAAGVLGIFSFGFGMAALAGTMAGLAGVTTGVGGALAAGAATTAMTATAAGAVGGAASVMVSKSQYNDAVKSGVGVKAAKRNLIMSSVGMGLSGLDVMGSYASMYQGVRAAQVAMTAGVLGVGGGIGMGVAQTTQGIQEAQRGTKGAWKDIAMGLGSIGMAGVGVYFGARGAANSSRGKISFDDSLNIYHEPRVRTKSESSTPESIYPAELVAKVGVESKYLSREDQINMERQHYIDKKGLTGDDAQEYGDVFAQDLDTPINDRGKQVRSGLSNGDMGSLGTIYKRTESGAYVGVGNKSVTKFDEAGNRVQVNPANIRKNSGANKSVGASRFTYKKVQGELDSQGADLTVSDEYNQLFAEEIAAGTMFRV